MERRTERICFTTTPILREFIRNIAENEGITVSDVLNRMIKQLFRGKQE